MRDLVDEQSQRLDQLATQDLLKDNLLAMVSHEFRTPLTAIIGFSQTLREIAESGEPLPADVVHMSAHRIYRNGRRLSRLIGNMLAATVEVVPHTERYYALRSTVQRIADDLRQATDHVTPVDIAIPEDLTVRMSHDHLELLLGNLIDNGLKFADPDTTLRIQAREAGSEIALTFTNHGPEIPPGMQQQIFARFVQVDDSDTRRHDGAGLGLHVVRRLCDAHGGGLELRCQDGLVVLGVTVPAGPRESVGIRGAVVTEDGPR